MGSGGSCFYSAFKRAATTSMKKIGVDTLRDVAPAPLNTYLNYPFVYIEVKRYRCERKMNFFK